MKDELLKHNNEEGQDGQDEQPLFPLEARAGDEKEQHQMLLIVKTQWE